MRVYIAVDFHARQQTISYLKTEDGEIQRVVLEQKEEDPAHKNVREFYAGFEGEVIVGLEAGGYSEWFEQMLEDLGHQVWVGNAAEIRRLAKRKQKNDRLDANHILDLMISDRFPRIHRRTGASRRVLGQITYRHKLVKWRTAAKNSLQAVAIGVGLSMRTRLYSKKGRSKLKELNLSEPQWNQAKQLLELIDRLTKEVQRVEGWLREQAYNDPQVMLVMTQRGVGLLTSLALVHVLQPVDRFANARQVTAYIGLDPVEDSSDTHKRIGSISKEGSPMLRFLLGQAAQSVVKYDPEMARFFRRIVKRRKRAIAIVAVSRKVLIRSYIMLRDQIDVQEFGKRGVEARSSRVAGGR
jgi:transposase